MGGLSLEEVEAPRFREDGASGLELETWNPDVIIVTEHRVLFVSLAPRGASPRPAVRPKHQQMFSGETEPGGFKPAACF